MKTSLKPHSLALALLAGTSVSGLALRAPSAHAQTKQPPARFNGNTLSGTITAASGATLTITLTSTHRAATVHLTSRTMYLVNGKPQRNAPSWKKGEAVHVMGTKAKNGSYTAQAVAIGALPAGTPGAGGPPGGAPGAGSPPSGAPPAGAQPPLAGTVVSSSATRITVKATGGKRTTLQVTSRTQFVVNGKTVSKRPTLKSGEKIQVMAVKSGTTLRAQVIVIGQGPGPGNPPQQP